MTHMNDPVMTMYVAIADHFRDHLPMRNLCVRMLTSILMDGSVIIPTDTIDRLYSTSKRWLRILEYEYTPQEIDLFYETLNNLDIINH